MSKRTTGSRSLQGKNTLHYGQNPLWTEEGSGPLSKESTLSTVDEHFAPVYMVMTSPLPSILYGDSPLDGLCSISGVWKNGLMR